MSQDFIIFTWMTNIVCVKWGDKYSAEYVNKLYSMVSRNMTRDFRFICFTDDDRGIIPNVEIFPLEEDYLNGWWHKITLFKPELFDLHGPTLYLDLDVVIIDSLECFFEVPGEFCIIYDWICHRSKRIDSMWNSSVFKYNIGSMSHIWEDFHIQWENIVSNYRWGDQQWISEKTPNAVTWNKKWCRSFKMCCAFGNDMSNPVIPHGARIIVFTGRPNPHEAATGFRKYGPVPWVKDYWK